MTALKPTTARLREFNKTPKIIALAFLLSLIGVYFRVPLPLLDTVNHIIFINTSQLLWISSLFILTALHLTILIKTRPDGISD
jgi:hypothetical protein